MIRFDIELEPPRKSPWPETLWHSSGGVYPFLLPFTWAWLIAYLLRCASLDDAPLPQHPEWLNDVWFTDTPYAVLLLVWFLGFWPLALLSSFLYRRQSERWWSQQRDYETHRNSRLLNLDSHLREKEIPLAAVKFNEFGLGGGGVEDVVIVTTSDGAVDIAVRVV